MVVGSARDYQGLKGQMAQFNAKMGDSLNQIAQTVDEKIQEFNQRILHIHGLALRADANMERFTKAL